MSSSVQRMSLAFVILLFGVANAEDFKREGTGEKRVKKDEIEGKTPPALQVDNWQNTDGKALSLTDLKGKVVVLDFWGVWCPPCRRAMPHLKELYERHKNDGLVVIGVHTSSQREKMADFVKQENLTWPIAADIDGETVKAFRVDSFPDYYLVDRAGKLRVADLQNGDLDRAVKILLGEKP
ncbi:MAG: TlpA family protein disulfide reductase [Planctomycetes bacterium]|nr:TlpA family protein disulfide reductase [Planctomycetota bacterium]